MVQSLPTGEISVCSRNNQTRSSTNIGFISYIQKK